MGTEKVLVGFCSQESLGWPAGIFPGTSVVAEYVVRKEGGGVGILILDDLAKFFMAQGFPRPNDGTDVGISKVIRDSNGSRQEICQQDPFPALGFKGGDASVVKHVEEQLVIGQGGIRLVVKKDFLGEGSPHQRGNSVVSNAISESNGSPGTDFFREFMNSGIGSRVNEPFALSIYVYATTLGKCILKVIRVLSPEPGGDHVDNNVFWNYGRVGSLGEGGQSLLERIRYEGFWDWHSSSHGHEVIHHHFLLHGGQMGAHLVYAPRANPLGVERIQANGWGGNVKPETAQG